MKVIAQFYWDCGRMGDVEGIFVCHAEDLDAAYDKDVYFGEILGKHSEVYGVLGKDDITILTDDQDFIRKFETIIGTGTVSGYNPLDYLQEEYAEDTQE